MTDSLHAITEETTRSLVTTLSNPVPDIVEPDVTGLIHASISPNTLRAYRGALERLDDWLADRAVDDNTLAGYIAHLHLQGLSASTISLAVAAVRFRARMLGCSNPAGPITENTLAGIRRSSHGRGYGQVAGVTWEEADLAVDNAVAEGSLRGLRDAALISVASDALLRVVRDGRYRCR